MEGQPTISNICVTFGCFFRFCCRKLTHSKNRFDFSSAKFLMQTVKPCTIPLFRNIQQSKHPIHSCVFSIFAICCHPFRMSFFIIYSIAEKPPSHWMCHFQFFTMQTFVEIISETTFYKTAFCLHFRLSEPVLSCASSCQRAKMLRRTEQTGQPCRRTFPQPHAHSGKEGVQ